MSNAVTAPLLRKAMGNHRTDYLVLSNKWASLGVEKYGTKDFRVVGRDGDNSTHDNQYKAVGRALEILARYAA